MKRRYVDLLVIVYHCILPFCLYILSVYILIGYQSFFTVKMPNPDIKVLMEVKIKRFIMIYLFFINQGSYQLSGKCRYFIVITDMN